MQISFPISYRILFFTLLWIGSSLSARSQNFSGHNWYFGNGINGMRFSRSTNAATLVSDKALSFVATGGSAVGSDKTNGNLLFYTDGLSIYDITHAIMPNGTGLNANIAGNQPVAVAKVPGQATQYYIFMNNANLTTGGSISFKIVDMAAFGNAVFPTPALGDGVGGNVPVAGLTGRSEAMITVPHSNGEDFWLITHANGTPDYTVTAFTAAGVGASNTFAGFGLIERAANFAYHEPTGRIAVSPQETTRDVEIVDFDNTTGGIVFNQRVLNTGQTITGNQSIYDTEWSNSGQYLYISQHGEAGLQADVFQYDLLNPVTSLVSVLPQPNAIFRSYGLQMAPDSLIYHLYQGVAAGPFLLGSFANSDTVASAVTYDPSAFVANPNFDGMQFPAFAPRDTVLMTVSFIAQGTCSNTPTSFFPAVNPGADSLIWDFGDGSGAVGWSPVYTYTAGGTFNATVTAFLNGNTATFTLPLTITQFDLQLQLVQDTTACACELPVNNGTTQPNVTCPNDTSDDMQVTVQTQGGSGTPTFQWFGPGGILATQTTATLRPDSAGYYYVVATLAGCSAYAGVNIKEYDSLDQRANIWYFGQNAGIDFNGLPDDPPVAITGPLNTPEGCSVISDRNGQVIFSTDGQRIYDKDDAEITPIPMPPGLGGEPGATQSALIVPVPGDETLFYIFTTQEVHGTYTYELRYSLFDVKLNNGQGGLTQYNQLLFSKSTERITASANWLIAHEYGNNSFRAYPISQQGIGNPVISAIGSDHSITIAANGQGYMELGGQNRLAVALSTPGVRNVVEVFDFVDSTGTVTNFRTANLNSPTGQVYGIEISPSGNKLYATLNDVNSQIHEFIFDPQGMVFRKQVVNHPGGLGAMQIGPDGQIYVAIDGSSNLGTFSSNEDTTQVTAFTVPLQPFALVAGTSSELGLPNFTQIIANPASTPGFNVTGLCLGDSTTFSATGKDPAIDKFDWFFGDGQAQADGGAQINHLYAAPGTYTVTVRIWNKCENPVATFTQDITITAPPADPSAGVNMCTGDAVLDANPTNVPGLTYLWETGATTETITVSQQGLYDVTVTDAQGCTTDGQFLASDNRPITNFGPDLTVCQNTPIFPLNAQNNGATYQWFFNGVSNGNTSQTQAVDTSTPTTIPDVYVVLVTDPVTLCFRRDTVAYDIKESPAFTATPSPTTACGTPTGQITLNITSPATSLFTYFVTGPGGTFSNIDQNAGVNIVTGGLIAGTYGVTVSDQVSGCQTITTASVNDNAFTVNAAQNGACDPTITINVSTTPATATPVNYRVIDNNTGANVPPGVINSPTGTFTTIAVPSGSSYVVEVTEIASNCIASSTPLAITQGPTLTVTFDNSQLCTSGVLTAVAAGATSFDWSASPIGSVTPTNAASVTVSAGTWNLQVTADDGAGPNCPGIGTIPVTVDAPTTADFTQTDMCADVVTLDATPGTGPYTYRWFRNGVLQTGVGGRQISATLADNGATFRVDIVNSQSGCVFSSPVKTVNVAGDLQVFITASGIPCEGLPFTLTSNINQTTGLSFQWAIDGANIPSAISASVNATQSGTYRVTVTRLNTGLTCTQAELFDVELAPITPGLLTDTGIICPDDPDPANSEIVLDPGPDFLSYTWFYEQAVIPNETDQTYTALQPGNYSVDLINLFGCPSSDQTTLIEECDPRVTGPNAFRPTSQVQGTGEFVNREFRLFTFFIDDTDFQIFIFNRWGEMIYQSNDRNFRWNGGYNNSLGQPLPPGTYSYVVRFKSSYRPDEGIKEQRGGVVLLR